jgi:hypothetical protein
MAEDSRCHPREGAREGQTKSCPLCGDPGQSVGQNNEKGGPCRGYGAGKRVKGRKRHILADTMGLLLMAVVHAANESEQAAAKQIMKKVAAARAAGASLFQRLRLLWVDAGCQAGKDFCAWVKALLGWRVEVIRRPKKSKTGKSAALFYCRAAG